jgi:ABC-type methionine transport system permease subunit
MPDRDWEGSKMSIARDVPFVVGILALFPMSDTLNIVSMGHSVISLGSAFLTEGRLHPK